MVDMKVALEVHRIKCEEVVSLAKEAETSTDVDNAYYAFCEAMGMEILITTACNKLLHKISPKASRAQCEAWSAWNKANSSINYDPETGYPRRI